MQQSVSGSRIGGDLTQIGYAERVTIGTAGRVGAIVGVFALVVVVVLAALYVALPQGEVAPDRTSVAPPPPVPVLPEGDQTEHDLWASSSANVWAEVPEDEWTMTSFSVSMPYIRSVEVGVGPNTAGEPGPGDRVLLRVLDEHGAEIDQGESAVVEWRAKVVFDHAVDVRPYLGRHLYLQLVNITDGPIRAYFTRDDRDRGVTSYMPCGERIPTRCPNPLAQDLSARVVSRHQPW